MGWLKSVGRNGLAEMDWFGAVLAEAAITATADAARGKMSRQVEGTSGRHKWKAQEDSRVIKREKK
jgi:hypothetical protein